MTTAALIDSHCHLADEVFAADLDEVVRRARDAGLERALVILAAGDEKEAAQARRLEEVWPDVRFAIGVHPHQAHESAGRRRQATSYAVNSRRLLAHGRSAKSASTTTMTSRRATSSRRCSDRRWR